MIITLDVFSGRPNPSWKLSDKKAKELIDRVAGRSLADADAVDNVLGYRGIVVSAASDDTMPQEVPGTFRIGGALAAGLAPAGDGRSAALRADEVDEHVRWLLKTGEHAVPDAVMAVVMDEIELAGQTLSQPPAADEAASETDASMEVVAAACTIANTAYNPGFWNVPAVQPKNNCYNYAMNNRTDTFAQPGRYSGHSVVGALSCASVGAAANWDGCTAVCNGSNKNVALVIWPGADYHWYRRHSEGFWGHKPGQTAARNTDNAGQLINGSTRTPANCNRGPYTIFCGYRFSPTGMKVK